MSDSDKAATRGLSTDKESADGQDPATRGDEDEIHSETPDAADDTPKMPVDFYYNYEDHQSRPLIMDESGLPSDLLDIHHSFGYDCHKRANLYMLDANTALFAAGNIVQLLNLKTKEQQYLRSTSGGGIGALTVHPSLKFFAVAEKGSAPNINIYEYPSLKLYRILRGGTEKSYSYVDFSPDGKLLASVGGDPDYMLTIWDWAEEKTVLRSKAFSQDVFRVTFSTELQGQLSSSGTGHIRFWKMAKTFTGLKLQGQLGKFGKTEISDIEGYVELPDGKVLSGSEWGNMLLWDGGLIKVEISRKGRKPCHNGTIQQIIMDEGELMTIGTDGYIRVWDFEKVDTADVTDESGIFEMEPMNELKVGNDVQLRSIVKSVDGDEPTIWYAQDANGGIWKLDLSFSFTSMAPERIVSYHSGVISATDTSPVSQLVATTGSDKTVRIFDYISKQPLCEAKFNSGGNCLRWAPKVVSPSGSTIMVGFEDGVVRQLTLQKKETTDVHGRLLKDVSDLSLKQAFKPHNKRVTCLDVDNAGEIMATGSEDNTVFFLNVGETMEPVGFINTPSAVTHLAWSPGHFKRNTLLVCCVEGEVLEVEAPEPGKFDTSKTFQITGLNIRQHQFKSIKSRIRHEEEMLRKAKEEEERRKKEEEERRKRIERGLETPEDQLEEEEKKPEEEPWEPYIPETPSPILWGFHGKEEGKFWLSMGVFDAGYLYECEFFSEDEKKKIPQDQLYEPCRSIPVYESHDVPIQVMKFSTDNKRVFMGMEDGSIRIHQLEAEDVGRPGGYWCLNIHDNNYGYITNIATSYDDSFLFTIGADGNFFAYKTMDQEQTEEKIKEAKAKIPSAKKEEDDKIILDIQDPKAYSIEDAKQKSEYDKKMRLAEEKKVTVRHMIDKLREQFRKLLSKNQNLPSHLQLDRKEFEMDPEIKRELERQTHEKIDHVRREMAWEEEKQRIALDKLRMRFKDVVECERIIVKAFSTQHEVCTFRAAKLDDDFYLAKADLEKRKTTLASKEELSKKMAAEVTKGQKMDTDNEGMSHEVKDTKDGAKAKTTLKGSMGERINKALAKVEDKKRRRALRKAMWEELYGSKPDEDYEDPNDVASIREAKENMGDYKLKSADDYVVPDHLRMNTEKAKSRLLVLKDLIHYHKYEFNQHVLSLRDTKIGIIQEIQDLIKKLGHVQKQLGPEKSKPLPAVPEMHPEEIPEKQFEYTRETLLKFKIEHAERMAAQKRGTGGGEGGFGGFGGGGGAAPKKPAESETTATTTPSSSMKQTSMLTSDHTIAAESGQVSMGNINAEEMAGQPSTQLTPLEVKIKKAEEIKLLYERDRLLARIEELLRNFDAELRVLRHEKFKLDIDLKNADLRHVTLFEELLLLKEFEIRENVLAAKLDGKQQEKLDQQSKVVEVQGKMEAKRKDIDKLQDRERALNAQFIASLGENNKFADFLQKVFKKKIKRTKKKANEGDGSDDESDDDSDSDEDWSESEEESDSEAGGYDLDACPPGCDQNLYDATCQLREKRLDIEEALAEEKKIAENLKKELEALTKKAKIIDAALKQAERELELFQLEKQQKVNELDVVVTLKFNQIQYVINSVLPQDLTPCLVFEAGGLTRLQTRIKELEHEKATQKRQQKDAKRKHVQLTKDRKSHANRITEMDDQCNKMMLQKFGRIVDLEKLETVTVNRTIEELKEKLRNTEFQCSTELNKWDERIVECKDRITELIRENTNRLDQLNMLLGEKKEYEVQLDSRQKNLGSEFTGVRKADVHERQRLVQLVHLQAQEIEALKEEITLLSRKGGHILPPAQPPLPPSANGTLPSMNT